MDYLLGFGGGLMCLMAWLTHIYHMLFDAKFGELYFGAVFFPYGIFSGILIWLGWR